MIFNVLSVESVCVFRIRLHVSESFWVFSEFILQTLGDYSSIHFNPKGIIKSPVELKNQLSVIALPDIPLFTATQQPIIPNDVRFILFTFLFWGIEQ